MAPSVSVQDQIEKLTAIVVGQHQVKGLARGLRAGAGLELGPLAAMCGVSAAELGRWEQGLSRPATGQALTWLAAVYAQVGERQASYQVSLRLGHAGSDAMGASYAGKAAETVALPRGGSEVREQVRGGPLETSGDDVTATLARLAEDWPSWKFERPKVGWCGVHAEHGQVTGVTSLELAGKLAAIDADEAVQAKRAAAFARG